LTGDGQEDKTTRRNQKMETGRLCVKTAGRDAGQYCAVVEVLDKNYVTIDGNVRRKKCNVRHLEPLDKVLNIKAKASTKEVQDAMKKEGIEVKEKKERTRPKKEAKKAEEKKPAEKKKAAPKKKAKK